MVTNRRMNALILFSLLSLAVSLVFGSGPKEGLSDTPDPVGGAREPVENSKVILEVIAPSNWRERSLDLREVQDLVYEQDDSYNLKDAVQLLVARGGFVKHDRLIIVQSSPCESEQKCAEHGLGTCQEFGDTIQDQSWSIGTNPDGTQFCEWICAATQIAGHATCVSLPDECDPAANQINCAPSSAVE